jgi:hypothetical protein
VIIELLKHVCESLEKCDIPYMVTGSIAMNIYSIPRMTRDIDIVLELTEERVNEFLTLFNDSYYNKSTIIDETRKNGIFNIIDHRSGFKIDFILRKNTEYYKLAFSKRQRIKELNTEFWVIRLEDLIIAKIIWIQQLQSENQMRDIQNLLLSPEKDIIYIKEWCSKLNLKTFDLLDYE